MSRRNRHQKNSSKHSQQPRRDDRGGPSKQQDGRRHAEGSSGSPQSSNAQRPKDQAESKIATSGNRVTFPSLVQPRKSIQRPPSDQGVVSTQKNTSYKLALYDTLAQAKADQENLRNLASSCDQLNIVVRAEGSMEDGELNSIGKLFCGAAWALVHERRKNDGWYDETSKS